MIQEQLRQLNTLRTHASSRTHSTDHNGRFTNDTMVSTFCCNCRVYFHLYILFIHVSSFALPMATDFLFLYNQVKLDHEDKLGTYRFPNKSMFNTFSHFTKVRRRDGFDELLKVLITINPLPQSVADFLELEEHIDYAKNSTKALNVDNYATATLGSDECIEYMIEGPVNNVNASGKSDDEGGMKNTNDDGGDMGNNTIIFPNEESLVNSQLRNKIPSIIAQVGVIMIVLFVGCLHFRKIEMGESSIIRATLTCITLILTFTFIKGNIEKRMIEKDIAASREY